MRCWLDLLCWYTPQHKYVWPLRGIWVRLRARVLRCIPVQPRQKRMSCQSIFNLENNAIIFDTITIAQHDVPPIASGWCIDEVKAQQLECIHFESVSGAIENGPYGFRIFNGIHRFTLLLFNSGYHHTLIWWPWCNFFHFFYRKGSAEPQKVWWVMT